MRLFHLYFFIPLFAVSFVTLTATAQTPTRCGYFYQPELARISSLHTATMGARSDKPTVKTLGINLKGQIEFLKLEFRKVPRFLRRLLKLDIPWDSRYGIKTDSSTPQGDLRNFIFFAGSRLASRFGFEIEQTPQGLVFRAPSAALLQKILLPLNEELKNMGKEPIHFLPVEAGYLKSGEALKMSLESKGDFIALFPFAEKDSQLAPHEVAYHLTAMLYPREFHERSRLINIETQAVIDSLQNSKWPLKDYLISALINDREFEIDAGNANPQFPVISGRLRNPGGLYRDITFTEGETKDIHASIRALMHPEFTPQEVVFNKVLRILELHTNPSLSRTEINNIAKTTYELERTFSGMLLGLTKKDQAHYKHWLMELKERSTRLADLAMPRKSPDQIASEFLGSLDSRIQDIETAFDRLESKGFKL